MTIYITYMNVELYTNKTRSEVNPVQIFKRIAIR